MKETQGSVEVTSFGQMENIIEYGHYRVGSDKPSIFQNINNLIHLRLEERNKRLSKKIYTLDELRDLESKLVLITGSKAENRKRVDQFLNVTNQFMVRVLK